MGFFIFFAIVLLINGSVNFYIIRRGLDALPEGSPLRIWLIAGVIFLASSYLLARWIEAYTVNTFASVLIWIGTFWMAFMVYFLLQLLAIDLLRLLNYFFGIFPSFITENYEQAKRVTAITVISIAALVVLLGHLNTWFPVVKTYELEVNKKAGNLKQLNVVMFSDLHLGTTIGPALVSRIVDRIAELKPDVILIPGDIIDGDIAPVLKNHPGDELIQLKAKYGVFGVTGNHEYIGGVKAAKQFLEEHNIRLLNDEAVLIDSSFYLVGREDRTKERIPGGRLSVKQLVTQLDDSLPRIMLDHQPFHLEQAEQNGIDLQVSGHTHNGQLWPFNFITGMVYELSMGYLQKGNAHIYVSGGVGGWGPPVRTVSRPEIVQLILKFKS